MHSMEVVLHFLIIIVLGASLLLFSYAEAGEVGVNYGRVADNLPNPNMVVQLLKNIGITMVRIYDANQTILTALANTGIKVQIIMMPNDELAAAAANRSYALEWVRSNVSRYYPATLINGVAVGNEVFVTNRSLTRRLLPAMINVQQALARLGLADAVKMTTPIHFSALKDTFPPSSGRFDDNIAQSVMKPMLRFLQRTGSYLSINPYPFFAYSLDPKNIRLDYARGNYKRGVVDNNTGLVYHSLLDAMIDATYYAVENLTGNLNTMQATGGGPPPPPPTTYVSETGWPTNGERPKPKPISQQDGGSLLKASGGFQTATVANAKAYNNYLINRILFGNTGTPHHPNADMHVFIFSLFNEDLKGKGPNDVERYFGLFTPGMRKVYDFNFHRRHS